MFQGMNLVMQIVTNDANSLPQVLQAAGSMTSLLCQEAHGGSSQVGEWGTDFSGWLRRIWSGRAIHSQL